MDIAQDIWRTIPPEEKFELIARSHSKGALAAISVVLTCCTFAVALQMQWMIWVGLLAMPFAFQFTALRAWRGVKGRIMLEYLAVRSVARRFGYATKATDLGIQMLIRAEINEEFDSENESLDAAFSAIESANKDAAMWVGLLNTALVGFAEGKHGAEARFVTKIDDKVVLEGKNTDGSENDYSGNRELHLTVTMPDFKTRKFKIDSPHPAALVTFEKKFLSIQAHLIELKKIQQQELLGAPEGEEY